MSDESEAPTLSLIEQDAVAAWKAATTEQGRSIAEERIWMAAPLATRRATVRRDYLSKLLGEGPYGTDLRRTLLHAPQALWDEIDGGERLTLSTAALLWRKTKKAAQENGNPLWKEIEITLDVYKKQGYVAKMGKDGRTTRRKSVVEGMFETEREQSNGAGDQNSERPKSWPARLRQDILELVEESSRDLPDLEKAEIFKWLDVEIRTLVANFRERASRFGRFNKAEPPSRKKVIAACRTLHIDPPAPGQPPDMVEARRAKRGLARAYHPDSSGDSSMRSLYEEVIQAYELLEEVARGTTKQKQEGSSDEKAI